MEQDDERQLAARADLARLLSACFYEPDPAFLDDDVFGQMAAAARQVDTGLATLATSLDAAFRAEPLQALLVDYTRLFLGPTHPMAAPYGSAWLGDSQPLMQETTLAVDALYREAGFEIAEDFRDLPDHVTVELEFLYAQLFAQAQARRAGDSAALEAANLARRRLLDSHLGSWAPRFGAALGNAAQSQFYRTLALLTAAFVEAEKSRA